MTTPLPSLYAGVFDMDGVLLDSEPMHHRAVNEILADEGRYPISYTAFTPYLGVADAARATWVEACLAALDIRACFDVVVSGDMVANGKPDPAIYLLAAQLLDTPPSHCFAVEDAAKGIAAAVAAGMLTVAIETPKPRTQRTDAAHIQLPSLNAFRTSFVGSLALRA
jgi:beta-phosphoglucomutase-like phosphatase (HAD superfamily)